MMTSPLDDCNSHVTAGDDVTAMMADDDDRDMSTVPLELRPVNHDSAALNHQEDGDCAENAASSRLQRENSSLTQLLSDKKRELDETRQSHKVSVRGLEDELERLSQEKERLLDRLQLPESERSSLRIEHEAVAELTRRLRHSEQNCQQLGAENTELRQELRDAELAMHELHDQFQAEEGLELRELQRELDNTARDCRLLHFKLRKAERRNDDLKVDCDELEEQVTQLNDELRRAETEIERLVGVDDELATAKQISIRLHDECERLGAQCQTYRQQLVTHGHSHSEPQSPRSNNTGSDITTPQQSSEVSQSIADAAHSDNGHHQLQQQQQQQQQSDGDELRYQLAITQQELSALKRHLTEARRENDDLLKAVAFLRNKLDASKQQQAAATAAVAADADASAGLHVACDDESSSQDGACPADDLSASADDHDVQPNAISALRQQLSAADEARYQLQCELANNRRDMDAMLETLRRKEKQFADERKQLERKNKELSDVFELFTERSGLAERRHRCRAARRGQLREVMLSCRTADDVSTQTDDVTADYERRQQQQQQLKRRVEQLERLGDDKDDVIRRHEEKLARSDVIIADMTRSVTSLEASLQSAVDRLSEKDDALERRSRELQAARSETEELQRLLSESRRARNQLEARLKQSDYSLRLKAEVLTECSQRLCEATACRDQLTGRLAAVSGELQQASVDLAVVRRDKSQQDRQLRELNRQLEQLQAHHQLGAAKQQRSLQEPQQHHHQQQQQQSQERNDDDVQQRAARVSRAATRDGISRHRPAPPPPPARPAATAAGAASPAHAHHHSLLSTARKLFDVHVKHERSASTANASRPNNNSNARRHISDNIPAKQQQQQQQQQQQLQQQQLLHELAEVPSASGSDVTVTSLQQGPAVVLRRRENATVPATFRRSRSMSEVDVLASEDDEQLPGELSLCATVTPSPTIIAPPTQLPLTSPLSPSCLSDVTLRPRRPGASAANQRNSFYASGTLSASASREHSPETIAQRGRYPRPPPSMIITPARQRSLSADRGVGTAAQRVGVSPTQLAKRLSDIMDNDVSSSVVTTAVTSRRRQQLTPKTARRKFYSNYPPSTAQQTGDSCDGTVVTSDDVPCRKASSHAEITLLASLTSLTTGTTTATTAAATAASSGSGSRLLAKWATLTLFRKKARHKTQRGTGDGDVSLDVQRVSMSSADVSDGGGMMTSRQVHCTLSQSQPLHHVAVDVQAAAASSGAGKTSSSSSSKREATPAALSRSALARIIDPLKLRRRPNSSSGDLSSTGVDSAARAGSSRRSRDVARPGTAGAPATSGHTGRRSRQSLTSAYMQGSL